LDHFSKCISAVIGLSIFEESKDVNVSFTKALFLNFVAFECKNEIVILQNEKV
jgi:hypothetical protein